MNKQRERKGWSRRQFLHGAGVAIGLPFFPSLFPRALWGDDANPPENVKPPLRLMFMCVPLGFVPNKYLFDCHPFQEAGSTGWFPTADGQLTKMPDVHASLEPYREHISFFKGLSNHKYRGDTHNGDDVFLTGADTFSDPSRALSNTISCDQLAAKSAAMGGSDVRFSSLAFGNRGGNGSHSGGLSWTDSGVPISPLTSPVRIFDMLFGKEDIPAEVRIMRMKDKQSILDATLNQIKRLNRDLNAADRRKLAEVVEAVKGVEDDIQRENKWLRIEKPKVAFDRPDEAKCGNYSSNRVRTMLTLAHAAFLTDSTRVISFELPGSFSEVSPFDKHQLNHDLSPEKARDAIKVDAAISDEVANFTKLLSDSKEHGNQSLLQNTMTAYGSGAWGANHCLKSLPVMLIGGGGKLKHGMTYVYEDKTPLANLWLTMLKTCGLDINQFADSTGTLEGLI